MNHYWTCSKFADWLRGTAKGGAKSAEDWDDWKTQAKANYPIRWWLAEEGLDYIQKVVYYVPDKIYSLKYFINNRFITHTHRLTAHPRDIKPGSWCDVGNRFLPCMFNELVDFVEVELAWWHLAWAGKEERKKYNAPWWRFGWWNVRLWRCPQAGIDNLKWQADLRWTKDEVGEDSENLGQYTPQAIKAQEILALYGWWTEVYRNRPEPMEASGWSAFCDKMRIKEDGLRWLTSRKTQEEQEESDRCHKLLREIEEAYEAEDEAMMIRLIKVRHGLWT